MIDREPGPVLPELRWALYVIGALIFLVGIPLILFASRTDDYFAWTIGPSLTAAYLGGVTGPRAPVSSRPRGASCGRRALDHAGDVHPAADGPGGRAGLLGLALARAWRLKEADWGRIGVRALSFLL